MSSFNIGSFAEICFYNLFPSNRYHFHKLKSAKENWRRIFSHLSSAKRHLLTFIMSKCLCSYIKYQKCTFVETAKISHCKQSSYLIDETFNKMYFLYLADSVAPKKTE